MAFDRCVCDVCSKCARTFYSRGTNEKQLMKNNTLLVRLHTKKCKGKMKLSFSIRKMIAEREIDNHLNVIPKKILERGRYRGGFEI